MDHKDKMLKSHQIKFFNKDLNTTQTSFSKLNLTKCVLKIMDLMFKYVIKLIQ
jgi:hypothetical protein